MNNLYSCFLRKVSKEVIQKLLDMGYTNSRDFDPFDSEFIDNKDFGIATSIKGVFTIIKISTFDSTDPYITWNCGGRVDCKDCSEYFLTVCSIRYDTDKGALFCLSKEDTTDHSGEWIIDLWRASFIECLYDSWEKQISECEKRSCLKRCEYSKFHKATIYELSIKYNII